jgi:hypothetical protein
MKKYVLATSMLFALAQPSIAGEADVLNVKIQKSGNGTYNFSVTVEHADAGWDHYTNKWEVVTPDGQVIATRVLAHPHDNEQPFTRSKSGVKVPQGVTEVVVRAGDSVHGLGGKEVTVKLN